MPSFCLTLKGRVHLAASSDSDATAQVRGAAEARGVALTDGVAVVSDTQEVPGRTMFDVVAVGLAAAVQALSLVGAVEGITLSPDPALQWWRVVRAEEVEDVT